MEKVKEFVNKHFREIHFFLINIIAIQSILFIFSFSGLLEHCIISSKILLYSTAVFSSLLFFLKYTFSKKKKPYKNISKGFFFVLLFAQIIATNHHLLAPYLANSPLITIANYPEAINILFYISGVLLILINRKELSIEKDDKKMGNKLSYFLLLLILIGFTLIKAPYFETNFTGAYTVKYNTYVEPAIYMVENNDFTWYQQKYRANPITNPKGISTNLPQLPILEWTLATTYMVFPNNSIELNTRVVMHCIGLLLLLFLFLLTKEWSNNTFAIILTSIMATNQIVGYSSFGTVYDSIIFVLLLISLFLLTKYLKENKKENTLLLSLAGIFIGIGASTKISLLIMAIPAITSMIFFQKEKLPKKVFNLSVLFLFLGIVYLTTKYSIPYLSTNFNGSILILLLGTITIISAYLLINKYKMTILNTLKKLHKKKILIPLLITLLILISFIGIKFVVGTGLVDHFLTDRRLLFSLPMYKYMLFSQFKSYITVNVFALSLLGLLLLFFTKTKNIKTLISIISISSLFFWIIASKSIMRHGYYTLIFMYTLSLLATLFIYFSLTTTEKTYIKLLLILFFSMLLLPTSITSTQELLSRQAEGFNEASQYLVQHTEPNDLYIDLKTYLKD